MDTMTNATTTLPAVIRVMRPCSCGAQWYRCAATCDTLVAEYDCDGIDGSATPTTGARRKVAAAHPGMDLVYA